MDQAVATTTEIMPERPGCVVTATFWDRDVDVYPVFDHEFRSIKSAASQSGLFLAFFGIVFGLALATGITLLTVDLTPRPWVFASFILGFASSFVASALLGFKARLEYKGVGKQFDYIEERSRKRGASITRPLSSSTPYTQDLP